MCEKHGPSTCGTECPLCVDEEIEEKKPMTQVEELEAEVARIQKNHEDAVKWYTDAVTQMRETYGKYLRELVEAKDRDDAPAFERTLEEVRKFLADGKKYKRRKQSV